MPEQSQPELQAGGQDTRARRHQSGQQATCGCFCGSPPSSAARCTTRPQYLTPFHRSARQHPCCVPPKIGSSYHPQPDERAMNNRIRILSHQRSFSRKLTRAPLLPSWRDGAATRNTCPALPCRRGRGCATAARFRGSAHGGTRHDRQDHRAARQSAHASISNLSFLLPMPANCGTTDCGRLRLRSGQ